MRIGLISDTHGFFDPALREVFNDCDQIWHAGDIGDLHVIENLETIAPVFAVYGNIDDHIIRSIYPEFVILERDGKKFLMTHIAGSPKKYNKRLRGLLRAHSPDILICGHSHICRVLPDEVHNLLYVNPGAAGNHGFHKIKTVLKFRVNNGKIYEMHVVELGRRGRAA
jgi:hypothetical protein